MCVFIDFTKGYARPKSLKQSKQYIYSWSHGRLVTGPYLEIQFSNKLLIYVISIYLYSTSANILLATALLILNDVINIGKQNFSYSNKLEGGISKSLVHTTPPGCPPSYVVRPSPGTVMSKHGSHIRRSCPDILTLTRAIHERYWTVCTYHTRIHKSGLPICGSYFLTK